MPNLIKYSTSAQTLALKSGDYWIGTGDVPKGPTSSSDYWNGITPPSGGYTIYLNKASQGPSIYTPLSDSDLIVTTNMIAQTSFTTRTECFNWFNTQSDKMVFNRDYPEIITSGLVLNLDAGFIPSYSTSGTSWFDLSSSGNNGVLTNGPTYSSENGGSIVLDGTNDFVDFTSDSNLLPTNGLTISCWFKTSVADRFLVTKSSNAAANGYTLNGRGSGVIQLIINGLGTDSTVAITNNNWTNCTATWIPSTSVTIYLNGSQNNINTTSIPASIVNPSYTIEIGRRPNGPDYWNGNVGQVLIYNRALTAAEVLINYNATKSRFGL